jgi:hypothetical protein
MTMRRIMRGILEISAKPLLLCDQNAKLGGLDCRNRFGFLPFACYRYSYPATPKI